MVNAGFRVFCMVLLIWAFSTAGGAQFLEMSIVQNETIGVSPRVIAWQVGAIGGLSAGTYLFAYATFEIIVSVVFYVCDLVRSVGAEFERRRNDRRLEVES